MGEILIIDVTELRRVTTRQLERSRKIQEVFFEQAKAGKAMGAMVLLKYQQHEAALLGLFSPVRVDHLQTAQVNAPTSTDRIKAVLDAIVAERPVLPKP